MNTAMFALSSGLVLAGMALAAPLHAQARNCAERDAVVALLGDRYGESRQSIGLGANNTMVEIYASLETGTWTITVTQPGGPTCLVASGQAFEHLAEGLPSTDPGA